MARAAWRLGSGIEHVDGSTYVQHRLTFSVRPDLPVDTGDAFVERIDIAFELTRVRRMHVDK